MMTTRQAKLFSAGAHAACGQKYGAYWYSEHLDDVADTLAEFRFVGDKYETTAYLHDVIEDTVIDRPALVYYGVPLVVVGAVEFCTDEYGSNRRVRKRLTYERVRKQIQTGGEAVRIGVAVKWADRISNLRHCLLTDSKLLSMYKNEQKAADDFMAAYMPEDAEADTRWAPVFKKYAQLLTT